MHFEKFLDLVKKEIEAEPNNVHNCRSEIRAFLAKRRTTAESPESHIYRAQLLEAFRNKNPDEVLTLIARGNKENAKTLQNLNANCEAVALRQKQRRNLICEEDCLSCSIKKVLKRILACIENCFCKARYCWGCCSQCCTDNQQPNEDQIEEEKQWIEILSNPLYISLKWFCRIYSESGREVPREGGDSNENQDVIATALRDAHLLEMIAGNDLHQHKQKYEERANEIEKFAVAVVEGSTRDQLIDIMDTKGDGCLKINKPWNFSQSLRLIKIAADEKRKKVGEFLFVTAPCGKEFKYLLMKVN